MVGCGLIDRSVTRICSGQGPNGGGWVSLTLFGQGGSKERGVKHKLTDLSSRSHMMSGTKKSCMGLLDQNTFKAIQSLQKYRMGIHARFIESSFLLS